MLQSVQGHLSDPNSIPSQYPGRAMGLIGCWKVGRAQGSGGQKTLNSYAPIGLKIYILLPLSVAIYVKDNSPSSLRHTKIPQESIDATFIIHIYTGKHLVNYNKDKEIYNPNSCHYYIYRSVLYL